MDEETRELLHAINETLQTLSGLLGCFIAYLALKNSQREKDAKSRKKLKGKKSKPKHKARPGGANPSPSLIKIVPRPLSEVCAECRSFCWS